jgi:hypothetical protein
MKASYVAMTKGSSTELTKEIIKQEYTSYSQPSTPAVTTDGGAGRSQRQKKYALLSHTLSSSTVLRFFVLFCFCHLSH